jgi:hypothetical protein
LNPNWQDNSVMLDTVLLSHCLCCGAPLDPPPSASSSKNACMGGAKYFADDATNFHFRPDNGVSLIPMADVRVIGGPPFYATLWALDDPPLFVGFERQTAPSNPQKAKYIKTGNHKNPPNPPYHYYIQYPFDDPGDVYSVLRKGPGYPTPGQYQEDPRTRR